MILIQEHAFKPVTVDHLEVHFVLEGNLFYQDSSQDDGLKEAPSEGCSLPCCQIIHVYTHFLELLVSLHWCSTRDHHKGSP